MKIKIKVHPLFYLALLICLFTGLFYIFLITICSVLIHELAHYLIARKYGYSLVGLTILPFGALLSLDERLYGKEGVAIALAGPIANLLIALAMVALWWFFPITYPYTDNIMIVNLVLGIFNLLPAFPLDMSRLLMSKYSYSSKVISFTRTSGITIASILGIVFIISAFNRINYSYAVMSILLMSGAIFEAKSASYARLTSRLPFVKKYNQGVQLKRIIISEKVTLWKIANMLSNTVCISFGIIGKSGEIILNVDESQVGEWFILYPMTTRVSSIIGNMGLVCKNDNDRDIFI